MLIIQPSLPAYRQDFFCSLAERLQKQITILHFGETANLKHPLIKEQIGKCYNLKGLKYVRDLDSIISSYSTVVTVFDPHWINLFTLPLYSQGKNIVLWGHGPGKNDFVNRLRVFIINRATSFVTYSEERKDRLLKLGLITNNVYVANNTLSIENLQDTSELSKKKFLFVGRLQRRKKLDVFFDVFNALNLGASGYSIVVVGDGLTEKKFLENYAAKLDMAKYVEFKEGTTSDTKLLRYFSDAKYYVSPGAVGLGVLHSFAYGVPVLTMADSTHGPEVTNIKDGISGRVFCDEVEFRAELNKLLIPETAKKMGRSAFVHYRQKRTIQGMVDEFIQALCDEDVVYK